MFCFCFDFDVLHGVKARINSIKGCGDLVSCLPEKGWRAWQIHFWFRFGQFIFLRRIFVLIYKILTSGFIELFIFKMIPPALYGTQFNGQTLFLNLEIREIRRSFLGPNFVKDHRKLFSRNKVSQKFTKKTLKFWYLRNFLTRLFSKKVIDAPGTRLS